MLRIKSTFLVWVSILWFNTSIIAQNITTVTLDDCLDKAVKAYPALEDKALLNDISNLKIKNIQSAYLPQLSVNGQATYQSDVVKINLPPQMGIQLPSPYKDQYKVTLDAQQIIYDGGFTNKQRKLETASSAAEIQQIETDLIRIKEQVNTLYFTVLAIQENRKLLINVLQVLSEKEKSIQALVKNGVLLKSDHNAIVAERLKTEQTISELDINKAATLRMLGILTNESFSDSTAFKVPEITISETDISGRPEFKVFDLQENKLNAASSLSNTMLMPKLYVFGQFGYGRPGLNMLNNEFDNFYIVGATLKWNFWDWNKTRREKQIYSIQKQMIINKKENFSKNLIIDIQNRISAIDKLEEALKRDADIVTLREGITEIAQSQLNNGVITSTDYISELNAETQARINLETHKIQLIQAKANYKLALGK